ncbi:MAG TPA: hypothetical protein VK901_01335 [Nitrospiraceae bacterium]|nr:hypothetical protein [Nitrospiraceae bacterium]
MLYLRFILGKLGLVCLGALILFLLLEGALELRSRLAAVPQAALVPQVFPDERLGYRPNPNFHGHDSRGWRNNSSPLERADIVVIGDSHVYGSDWPQRVGARLHRTVYQMGVGGYGPAQYALLLDEAMAFEPQVIIAAYDYGDDIYDSYRFVYRIGNLKRSALDTALDSSFALMTVKSQQALTQAETIDPGLLRRKYLDCGKPVEVPDPRLQVVHEILASPPLAPLMDEGMLQRAVALLTDRSAPVKVLRKRFSTTVEAHPNAEDVWPKLCYRYRDQKLTTLFSPGYRLLVLDDTDPRIVEGERIALLAYQLIAQRCRRPRCSFYVMMIPTKESAFRARVESSLGHQSYMVDLWNAEKRAHANASAFFTREHIATIDTLPFLEELIASDVNPYPEDSDIHPVEVGYDAIARAVVEQLERDGIGR